MSHVMVSEDLMDPTRRQHKVTAERWINNSERGGRGAVEVHSEVQNKKKLKKNKQKNPPSNY